MDAQKAVDNMDWNFVKTITIYEFWGNFIRIIQSIYSKQKVKIKRNGEYLEGIEILQGARQKCPLSLLFFILMLEILNNVIRQDDRIQGMKIQ